MRVARKARRTIAGAAVLAAAAAASGADFGHGPKLVGAGVSGPGATFGRAVALAADGNTAVVGGPFDASFVGAAWFFERTAGNWRPVGAKQVGNDASGAAFQGIAVAMSADGTRAIVGGSLDAGFTGAAWIYLRVGNAFVQQGGKLVGTPTVAGAFQGTAVAMSGDGNTVLVGAPSADSSFGAAWVFVRDGTTWTQQDRLVGTGAAGNPHQGASVALSYDGSTAIVGGPYDDGEAGAAWVFTRTNGVWAQQGTKLVGAGGSAGAHQGASAAVSADGSTALLGGPLDGGGAGAAWVFVRSGASWSQQGAKLVGAGASADAQQGSAVALAGDGATALLGGDLDAASTGATWAFRRSQGAWSPQTSKLVGPGAIGAARQGSSVALSADGVTALVGGTEDGSGLGAAWVYMRPCRGAGDANGDGATNVTDVFYLINFLFAGGASPTACF